METGLNSEVDVTEREDGCLYIDQRLSDETRPRFPNGAFVSPGGQKETGMGFIHPTLGCPSIFGVCLGQTRALG